MNKRDKLNIKFCGINLKNPVVAASATPTRDFGEMKKCIEAGVGALVGKSASFQRIERIHPSPCFYVMYPKAARQGKFYSLYSSAQLAEFSPEEYADQMKKIRPIAKDNNCKIISDIMRGNIEEWKRMTEIFAPVSDLLELNVGCPFAGELAGEEKKGAAISSDVELICQIIEAVREITDLPLMIKLSIEGGDLLSACKAIEKMGVEGVHLNHRFTGLEIDVETGKPILNGTICGYGGSWMAPISRKWVARVSQNTQLDICAGGGIDGWRDAVASIMAGASMIQMATAPMLKGHEVFAKTIEGIEKYLNSHGYDSINDIKGIALKYLRTLEEVPRRDVFRPRAKVDKEKCNGCGHCEKVCFYSAIEIKEGLSVINEKNCKGCALCTQMCPTNAIKLTIDGKEVPVSWKGSR